MARAELVLDLAAYKQALQQARPALQVPGRGPPPPPSWYPGLGPPRLAVHPPTTVTPALSNQSLGLEVGSSFPHVEGSSLQTSAPPPGQLTVPGPSQPPSTPRAPPMDSPPSFLAEPSTSMLAMFSLLDTMAPYSQQVPNSDLDSLRDLVIQTYSVRR